MFEISLRMEFFKFNRKRTEHSSFRVARFIFKLDRETTFTKFSKSIRSRIRADSLSPGGFWI